MRYRLGEELTDRYLEFVAGWCRPNTLRAAAFDLKAFFTVIAKEPTAVPPADVFEFLAHQRGNRTVVRLADRESGLSARTIAPAVVGVGPVCLPGGTERHSGAGQPGAARPADPAAGHDPSGPRHGHVHRQHPGPGRHPLPFSDSPADGGRAPDYCQPGP